MNQQFSLPRWTIYAFYGLIITSLSFGCTKKYQNRAASGKLPPYDVIKILNPSLEKSDYRTPWVDALAWSSCPSNNIEVTPPDYFNKGDSIYGCKMDPADGEIFIGLVARSDASHEGIKMNLNKRLLPGYVHSFKLSAGRCSAYITQDILTRSYENFNKPIILRIWGSFGECKREELLAISDPQSDVDVWKQVRLEFNPLKPYKFLIIDVYHDMSQGFDLDENKRLYKDGSAYNGHVLIDNFSDITVSIPD